MNARGKKPGRLTEADRERWREMLARKNSVTQQGYRAVMGRRGDGGGIPRPQLFAEILAQIDQDGQDDRQEAAPGRRQDDRPPGRQRTAQGRGEPGQRHGQDDRQRAAQGRGEAGPHDRQAGRQGAASGPLRDAARAPARSPARSPGRKRGRA